MTDNNNNIIIGNNWKIIKQIDQGAFGIVYSGIDIRNNTKVAIKIEYDDCKMKQISNEYKVYRKINNTYINTNCNIGISNIYWSNNNNILVIDLFHFSLDKIFNDICNKKFSLKTITMIAIHCLRRIELLHELGYVYKDIKPNNFLTGYYTDKMIYLVDFGLCSSYISNNNNKKEFQHIPYKEYKDQCMIGTPRYASINVHLGREYSRRDDLESIAYMLIYFIRGSLPWQNIKTTNKKEKYDKIGNLKMTMTLEEICTNCPIEFKTFLQYCRTLEFSTKPDYNYIKKIFYDLFKTQKWTDDCIYDWNMDNDNNSGKRCKIK